MEIEKDLTPELNKLGNKAHWYQVKGTLKFLPAPQDPKTARPYTYKKTGWGSIERVEAHMATTPTATTAPRKFRKIRTGEGEIQTPGCHSFALDDKGRILIPWGGYGGLFKSSWRRTLAAKAARDWEYPKADLIKCYPSQLKVPGPIDSQANGAEPKLVLTTRHTSKGEVMVNEFFDWIKNRPIEFYLKVDAENPINEEKFVGMLSSFNTLDSFGPSKKGELELTDIQQVKLTAEELREIGA